MKFSLIVGPVLVGIIAAQCAAQAPALMTPTREHQELAREAGVWDGESSLWPTPDAEPLTSKGVETNEMMGGFWLVGEYVGDMGGQEFRGRSQTTYDPIKKKYVGTWIDTMSCVMLTVAGDYDVKTHTMTAMMEGTDAMTGQPGKWKGVTRYIDDDTKVFEMYAPVAGQADQWWKMMEIKYKRRK